MKKTIKVLYIAGASRSGSTLLSNILGELNGFFNAGELIDFWDRGLAQESLCGCGQPLDNCSIWAPILAELKNNMSDKDADRYCAVRDRYIHSYRLINLLHSRQAQQRFSSHLEDYPMALERLYLALKKSWPDEVLVDASKNAAYAYLLSQIPGIDLYILHLVRDARATAFSWQRRKSGLHREGPLKSSLVWTSRNVAVELLCKQFPNRHLRIFYDDFIRDVRSTLDGILEMLAEPVKEYPLMDDRTVRLGINHSIYGNPNRFKTGIIPLKPDEEWKEMPWRTRWVVNTLTWPLLFHHDLSKKKRKSLLTGLPRR